MAVPPPPVRPPRFDAATRGYLGLIVGTLAVGIAIQLLKPELLRPGSMPFYAVGMSVYVVAGVYVLCVGRLGPVAIHPLTVAAMVGGNMLVFLLADDLTRLVCGGWNVINVMYLAATMPRRTVIAYGALASCLAVANAATIPGEPIMVLIRTGVMAGLVVLPIASFLMLRGELDDALAATRELASRDALTGLFNRRGMFDAFPVLASGPSLDASALAVLVCDLDHFKRINDSLGHAVGDDVLRQVGATLRSSVREGDIVVRLGGEELGVIAAVDGPEGARELAERLRGAVQRDCARWSATMSVGIALDRLDRAPGLSARLERLLAEADLCLYEAKNAGRNRVVGPTTILAPTPAGSATLES